MRTFAKLTAFALSATLSAGASVAQEKAKGKDKAPKELSSSPTATLYRVDEGIFDLKEGQAIDLTDRKLLMTFRKLNSQHEKEIFEERQHVTIIFGGRDFTFYQGTRLDLRSNTNIAPKLFADKSACYIDHIANAAPKGGTRVATFRFVCE